MVHVLAVGDPVYWGTLYSYLTVAVLVSGSRLVYLHASVSHVLGLWFMRAHSFDN